MGCLIVDLRVICSVDGTSLNEQLTDKCVSPFVTLCMSETDVDSRKCEYLPVFILGRKTQRQINF